MRARADDDHGLVQMLLAILQSIAKAMEGGDHTCEPMERVICADPP
jgi:hypothetical protein